MSSKKKILIIALSCIAIISGALVVFWPFGGSQHVNYIPGNASVVLSVDVKSLFTKANSEKLEKSKFYTGIQKDLPAEVKAFVEHVKNNPLSSGIDWTQKSFLFLNGMKQEDLKGGFVFKVTNDEQLGTTISKLPEASAIKKESEYSYVEAGSKDVLIGWNEKVGIVVFGNKKENEKYLQTSLALPKNESMVAMNKGFSKFLDSKHDVGFFLNHTAAYEFLKNTPGTESNLAAFAKMKDGNSVGYLNFENGAVNLELAYLPADGSKKVPFGYKNEGIGNEIKKNITDKDVYGILSMNFDIPVLLANLKENKEFAEGFSKMKEQFQLSDKDIENVFSGEIAFAFLGLRETTYTKTDYNWETGEIKEVVDTTSMPVFTLNLGIKDHKVWEKISFAMNMQKDSATGVFQLPLGFIKGNMAVTKSGITVSNDLPLVQTLTKNGSLQGKIKPEIDQVVSKNGFAGYFTFNETDYSPEMITAMKNMMGDSDFIQMKNMLSIFSTVMLESGESNMTIKLNLSKKEENSLYSIINHFDEKL